MHPSLSPGSFAVLGCGPRPHTNTLALTPSLRHLEDDLRHFHAKHAFGYTPPPERPSETLTDNPKSKTLKRHRHQKQATPKPPDNRKRSETPPPPRQAPQYQTAPEHPANSPLDPSTRTLQAGNGSREQAPGLNPKILELPKLSCAKTGWSSVPWLGTSLSPHVWCLLCRQSFLFEDKNDCFFVLGMNCFN